MKELLAEIENLRREYQRLKDSEPEVVKEVLSAIGLAEEWYLVASTEAGA